MTNSAISWEDILLERDLLETGDALELRLVHRSVAIARCLADLHATKESTGQDWARELLVEAAEEWRATLRQNLSQHFPASRS